MITIAPDAYRANLRGVIKALVISDQIISVHFIGQGLLCTILLQVFGFTLDYGLEGLWVAKTIVEVYVAGSYIYLIYKADWYSIAQQSVK